MLNIVVLDAYPYNINEFDRFKKLGNVTVYTDTLADQTTQRISNADIIITNKVLINEDVLRDNNSVKLVVVSATGYNVVDAKYLASRNIPVTNVPGYGTNTVAQHALALLLNLTNHISYYTNMTKHDEWAKSGKWCIADRLSYELAGKTAGIIGSGAIGLKLAEILSAMGMNILLYSRHKRTDTYPYVSLEELLAQSDVISLHCTLTPETNEIINGKTLALMKKTALLVNTSRGGLINLDDLYTALNTKQIQGAALDVLPFEPPVIGSKLNQLDNCIITPHSAWASREAFDRILDICIQNTEAYLAGDSLNVVNL